ncbi:hypothetical protein FQY83_11385 [Luteimonas marina]|uniref:Uncharacterized protein n=1 Tax=Luteimonas marina TaxID=488485 RepID=A0A5C5U4D8_9GAMM|nr:hypothetical protein [Luteimonas marina]TWT20325.1 hypothetical protein FQY83_11385 [Luteimonas marina]
MLDDAAVQSLLGDISPSIHGSVVSDVNRKGHFYVFVDVNRDKDNKQVPSNFLLHNVKRQIEVHGVEVDFVLLDARQRDAESGLRATVLHSFGEHIRNVFLSTTNTDAVVWLDAKRGLESGVKEAVAEKARIFLTEVGFDLKAVETTSGENLPSRTACLRIIRASAPVSIATLDARLRDRGFTVPSADWLTRRLDSMRRAGLIVRLQTGEYVLSLASIRAMGTSKNRRSPDIERLLALAAGRH